MIADLNYLFKSQWNDEILSWLSIFSEMIKTSISTVIMLSSEVIIATETNIS